MTQSSLPIPLDAPGPVGRLHRLVTVVLQVVMGVELIALLRAGLWQSATIVAAIMGLTLAPTLLRERLPVRVPYAFQMMVVLFVFAALYLGEVLDYYERFWWWDMALHTSSGLLVGIFGFMLLYLMNQNERVHVSMMPGFMALFAFAFAMALGTLWEFFEFAMDTFFGMNMQKPMLEDTSGLTDTMMDMLVNALGALVVSLYGYRYMKRGEPSLLGRMIMRVAQDNPEWFRTHLRSEAGKR